jgi:hypothetical protein
MPLPFAGGDTPEKQLWRPEPERQNRLEAGDYGSSLVSCGNFDHGDEGITESQLFPL